MGRRAVIRDWPLSIERLQERGENMGYIDAGFTADAPQGEL